MRVSIRPMATCHYAASHKFVGRCIFLCHFIYAYAVAFGHMLQSPQPACRTYLRLH